MTMRPARADTLIDNLTVHDMLLYTAELKLRASVPLAVKRQRVDGLIEQLALGACRDVHIGDAMQRGISGAAPGRARTPPRAPPAGPRTAVPRRRAGQAHQHRRGAHQLAPHPVPG